ncbi:hypothetical protein Q4603_20605 [Zobellia galactanivorans]|uniref:hypothetical protein n=1 Tax=Zobellia galactanivorans (strain DSM 12802 / CCUG 47099 / CIP 106680 / NCIMB 13871 / Dsij) TaxID=63186 RepID=UPI0026E19A60|nr:hypothetical protein [Zobellia galactanivorans]MDO6811034.1 hypothetical protein [Zobellia galactanivorans]
MKRIELLRIIACSALLFSLGCSKDDDSPDPQSGCLNKSWGEQTQAEVEAVTAAAATFSNEPSKASCENFRTAYIDYIEALQKLESCVPIPNQAAFAKALEDGKIELAKLDCNQDF